jgi:hypothetical protein
MHDLSIKVLDQPQNRIVGESLLSWEKKSSVPAAASL